jgi:hypothetical protein
MAVMPNALRRTAAVAATLLGSAHLVYGMIAFKALTPDHIWFAGAGVAMICVGLSNWHAPARVQAGIMSVYCAVMASQIPLPQIFIGLAIFITLTLPDFSRRKV